jgi:protein SCO1/2
MGNVSSTKKKITTVLILAAILVMPGFLYYVLQDQGKNRYRPLSFFGPKTVGSTFRSVRGVKVPDTIYHTVENFKLVNQLGDTVSLSAWKGKVVIVNLFYAHATTEGVKSALKSMQSFSSEYQKNSMVHLASINVDPSEQIDSLFILSQALKADANKWDLLTGNADQISELIRKSLLLDAVQNTSETGAKFTYSNKMVLLDSKHRIRGFYESTNAEEVSKLDDEIKVLIAEELRNIKDGR